MLPTCVEHKTHDVVDLLSAVFDDRTKLVAAGVEVVVDAIIECGTVVVG